MTDGRITKSESSWIVHSKFELTRPNVSLVVRRRLLETLHQSLDQSLVLALAPAGYGKSTLITQWVHELSEKDVANAWLTLDEGDSDPSVFLAYIVLAFAHAGLPVGDLEIGAQSGFSDTAQRLVLNRLMDWLRSYEQPIVLVLDDFHRLESSAVEEVVSRLIHEAPPNLTTVIVSRTVPNVDVATLMAAGLAIEMSPAQLRFSRAETASVLGNHLKGADIDAIHDFTEGWPVAIQLYKVQLRTRPDAPLKSTATKGLLASYLTDQVLTSVDEEMREFLLSVCALERFDPELANAVRGADDSWRLIEELAPLTALFVPINEAENWFRLHHLFAEHLREVLKREAPAKLADINGRASAWHAERGDLVEAVRYAAQAGDFEACERLILEGGGYRLILTEGIGVLRSLLRRVPEERLRQGDRLMVAKAYLACKDGEHAHARALVDESATLTHPDPEEFERDYRVVVSMLNVYEDRPEWTKSGVEVHERNEGLERIVPLERGTLKCEEVLAFLAEGKFEDASSALSDAFRYMRQSGSVLGLNYCYLHAACIALLQADFRVAEAHIKRASEMADSNFGSDSGLKFLATILDLALKIWRGDAGSDDLNKLEEALKHTEAYDGWTEMFMIGLDAACHLCAQLDEQQRAIELGEWFMDAAERRSLRRLEVFSTVVTYRSVLAMGRKRMSTHLLEKLKPQLCISKKDKTRELWQSQLLFTGVSAEANPADKNALNEFDEAIKSASSIGAELLELRLQSARLKILGQHASKAQVLDELTGIIERASVRSVFGPFLGDSRMSRLLREARDLLRNDESKLLVANALTELVVKAGTQTDQPGSDLLSHREQEIMLHLADGLSNKEIARQLELTENTVKFHLKNIFAKLNVSRRTQAIAEARALQLID